VNANLVESNDTLRENLVRLNIEKQEIFNKLQNTRTTLRHREIDEEEFKLQIQPTFTDKALLTNLMRNVVRANDELWDQIEQWETTTFPQTMAFLKKLYEEQSGMWPSMR